MTTFRVQHNKHNPYAVVDKGFLDNPKLTAKAKGIFAYLLSKPDNWRVHLNHLVTVFQDGHTAIRSGLKELQAAGYGVKVASVLKVTLRTYSRVKLTNLVGFQPSRPDSDFKISRLSSNYVPTRKCCYD